MRPYRTAAKQRTITALVSAEAERGLLRTTFDDSPDLYERSRLVAPSELFDDLVALARLEPGARLVEIGCGTGQATLPLAERGFEIVGIELGERLAEYARRKLARFTRVSVVTSSFEEWQPADAPFDGVVAFNAFHWIDPEVRFTKSAEVLRAGGALAVMGSAFAVHDDADATWLALEDDYVAVVGECEPRPHVDAARDRSGEFVESGYFGNVAVRRYLWDAEFDADGYLDRLRTSSWHARLPDDVRRELFDRIRRRILAAPGQTIAPTTAAILYVAERNRVGALE